MKYTKEQIEQKFERLPEELKGAITSVETVDTLDAIGKKHSLMLDQTSELADETGLLILGLTKSSIFVKNISDRLNISTEKASEIAQDINSLVLGKIRLALQKIQEESEPSEPAAPSNLPTTPTISAIEQAGQFTVEPQPKESTLYNNTNIDKQKVLNKIEEDHVPLVDHLLTTPVSNPQKTEVKTKPYTVDPYREAV